MNTLFSTAEVHPRDRFDYWHSIACRTIVNHDSVPECPESFSAELRVGSIGDIDLIGFENSPMQIDHTERHASQTASDTLFLCRQLAGRLGLEQQGRELILNPGELTLLDPRFPYKGWFERGSRLLLLKLPRADVEARVGSTRGLLAAGFVPESPAVCFASDFVLMVAKHTGAVPGNNTLLIRNQVLDTVALALFAKSRMHRSSLARGLVRERVRAAIRAQLANPDASVDTIADAAGVGVRYANAVLADEGTSVMRLLIFERVERCRGALENSLQTHRTISDIAYGWGFSDMTHFGRAFKKMYGMSPRAYRRSIGH